MLEHMRCHDRYKMFKPEDLINYHHYLGLDAEEIAMDDQWQEIMVTAARGRK